MRFSSKKRYSKKVICRLRNFTKSIDKLILHIIALALVFKTCYSLIYLKLLLFIQDIIIWNKCTYIQIYRCIEHFLFAIATKASLVPYGFLKHLAVHIISNCLHVTTLLFSKKTSGASYLKISHSDLKSASKIGKLSDSRKSLFGNLF